MIDYFKCKQNRYIYAWYYTNTNEIFYIGKGTNGRWKDVEHSRNNLFKSIIKKHLNNGEVAVKKLYKNLSEEESLIIERELIHKYWNIGQCKANFHEGGHGGYTGNYNNPERSRKISEKIKAAWKDPNSKMDSYMRGKHQSEETKQKIREQMQGRKDSLETRLKKSIAIKKQHATPEYKKKASLALTGIKRSKEWLYNNRMSQAKNHFFVKWDGELIYDTYFKLELYNFLNEKIGISRAITEKILKGNYQPKFNRCKKIMEKLSILVFDKSVSTIPDECKGVDSEISTESKCVTSLNKDGEIVSLS